MFVFDNIQFAGTVLIRELIESQNYEPSGGTDGWAFFADGSAFVNTIRGYVFKTGEPPAQRIEMDTTGLNFYVDDPSVNGITGPAQIYTVDPSFYIASLIGVGDTAVLKLTPGDGTFPAEVEVLNAFLTSDAMEPRAVVVNAISGTASLAFVAIGGANVTLVVPPSGKINVHMDGAPFNTVAANRSEVGFNVRKNNAAGAVLYAGTGITDIMSRAGAVATFSDVSKDRKISGLTPGDTIYVEMLLRTSAAGTASLQIPALMVTPLM